MKRTDKDSIAEAVLAYNGGESAKSIARRYQVGVSTVNYWVRHAGADVPAKEPKSLSVEEEVEAHEERELYTEEEIQLRTDARNGASDSVLQELYPHYAKEHIRELTKDIARNQVKYDPERINAQYAEQLKVKQERQVKREPAPVKVYKVGDTIEEHVKKVITLEQAQETVEGYINLIKYISEKLEAGEIDEEICTKSAMEILILLRRIARLREVFG